VQRNNGTSTGKFIELRKRAEDLLAEMEGTPRGMSQEEARKTVRELNIRQIELELQNEDLRQAQVELERSSKRINDLYEFAPVSYLTVSDTGIVIEANLTAAEMLGVEKRNLLNTPLSKFIVEEYQDTYYLCRRAILESKTKTRQCVELRMKKEGGGDSGAVVNANLLKIQEMISVFEPLSVTSANGNRLNWNCREYMLNLKVRYGTYPAACQSQRGSAE